MSIFLVMHVKFDLLIIMSRNRIKESLWLGKLSCVFYILLSRNDVIDLCNYVYM